ncbi:MULTISPECIES: acetyl-CoA carboxylase biotin carboxyl carrier protein [unclassified Ligilactobacillus]|uniref:acetyl-CoA carboxylase biotin carboxyl carrier protein n=1 Tax=unclassified Ligilactobacillus TaxID=2767920 RepID=UPI0038537F86
MNFNEIKDLMAEFNASPTRELEITEENGFRIRLSKNDAPQQDGNDSPVVAPASQPVAPAPVKPTQPVEVSQPKEEPVQAKATQQEGPVIKAPMVGTVYLQAKPDSPAYVTVGQPVHKGDVVCIIEAMKMMTEIKSDVDGVIAEVLVDNEDLVEFDQPLFRVTEG